MSKADDHFFNVFSVVIGILVATTLVIFAIARFIGTPFEEARSEADPKVRAQISERLAPFGQVAVAGQDNDALAIVAANTDGGGVAGAGPAALPESAEAAYQTACAACHAAGIAGAPKSGDRAAWAPRIAQGTDTLYAHSIEGFQGQSGYMPPKGGRADWPDDLIRQIVDYMVAKNR